MTKNSDLFFYNLIVSSRLHWQRRRHQKRRKEAPVLLGQDARRRAVLRREGDSQESQKV